MPHVRSPQALWSQPGPGQHPSRGHHLSQHPNMPRDERPQQQHLHWEQSKAAGSQNAECETNPCQKARAFCRTRVLKAQDHACGHSQRRAGAQGWILPYHGSLEDVALESKELGLICSPRCP